MFVLRDEGILNVGDVRKNEEQALPLGAVSSLWDADT